MPRRQYVGNAAATTLNGAITAGSAEIQITDATSWPTGSPGPFVVIVDRGLAAEEKILITSRTGTTLFVSTRGFDSTTAASHSNGATIEHGLSATDIDEANDHVFDTTNDDHTQYLNNARHDVEGRHTFGAALGTAATPTGIAGSASAGSGANPAREDHVHLGGQIGYGTQTATQTGITTVTDLTGASATVTVGTDRRVKITAYIETTRTVADGTNRLLIQEGATILQTIDTAPNIAGDTAASTGSVVLSPSAGAHTYKLTLQRVTGTGTAGSSVFAGAVPFILVEDIGAI